MTGTAVALLARLDDLGVTARADGGTLRIRPASAVPPALMSDLRAHKAEVLAALMAGPATDASKENCPDAGGGTLAPATAEQAADEAADRAAIAAEPLLPTPGTSERHQADARHRAAVDALRTVARKMPPSLSDAGARPTAGEICACRSGARWWTERVVPRGGGGWRCVICPPPDHLPEDAVKVVDT